MNKKLKTIAVDLTPVLPGGENGGAKIFVLELLRCLAEIAPQTQFVLLTRAESHEELSVLDRSNIRRTMVFGAMGKKTLLLRLKGLSTPLLQNLPEKLCSLAERIGYRLYKGLRPRETSNNLIREMDVDLLFCPFTAPIYHKPGIPMVCTIHDLQYITYPEFFADEDVAHRKHTFTTACRQATILTAVSDYSRDIAISHGQLDPSRIRTIYHRLAQRIAPCVQADEGVLASHGLTYQRYLIYPANFWKHKNHEMLLTSFGMACHQGLSEDIKLVCTGSSGPRQEWLSRAALTMNLGERILFPGYLTNTGLAALMKNCAGVIFPSLYEGFGLPVIEAMALGVPVACSNTTSLPEVAGDAAILFDPRIPTEIAQAIISLVENKALRDKLIQSGKQRSIKFSDGERMAREYYEIFKFALAKHKNEDYLTGAYADSWAGHCLKIQVAPAASKQTLEIEFSAPDWLPQSRITAKAVRCGKLQCDPLVIDRGADAVFSISMEPTGGFFEIRIDPTFVPVRTGHGKDHRELSVTLRRCGILRGNNEYVELFPERVSK